MVGSALQYIDELVQDGEKLSALDSALYLADNQAEVGIRITGEIEIIPLVTDGPPH